MGGIGYPNTLVTGMILVNTPQVIHKALIQLVFIHSPSIQQSTLSGVRTWDLSLPFYLKLRKPSATPANTQSQQLSKFKYLTTNRRVKKQIDKNF